MGRSGWDDSPESCCGVRLSLPGCVILELTHLFESLFPCRLNSQLEGHPSRGLAVQMETVREAGGTLSGLSQECHQMWASVRICVLPGIAALLGAQVQRLCVQVKELLPLPLRVDARVSAFFSILERAWPGEAAGPASQCESALLLSQPWSLCSRPCLWRVTVSSRGQGHSGRAASPASIRASLT